MYLVEIWDQIFIFEAVGSSSKSHELSKSMIDTLQIIWFIRIK